MANPLFSVVDKSVLTDRDDWDHVSRDEYSISCWSPLHSVKCKIAFYIDRRGFLAKHTFTRRTHNSARIIRTVVIRLNSDIQELRCKWFQPDFAACFPNVLQTGYPHDGPEDEWPVRDKTTGNWEIEHLPLAYGVRAAAWLLLCNRLVTLPRPVQLKTRRNCEQFKLRTFLDLMVALPHELRVHVVCILTHAATILPRHIEPARVYLCFPKGVNLLNW